MDDDEEYEEAPFGLGSSGWMLEYALAHVSHTLLYHGVIAMASYLTETEEPDVFTALDILAQTALSGRYQDPYEEGVQQAPERARLSDEEKEAEIEQFRQALSGIPVTPIKRKPPTTGDTNEEEDDK